MGIRAIYEDKRASRITKADKGDSGFLFGGRFSTSWRPPDAP